MKVSSSQPYQIIYSLSNHEYLGFIVESFIVQINDLGKLTYQHQKLSPQNAKDFSPGLDRTDFEIIDFVDRMNPETVVRKWSKKQMKPKEFLSKVFHPQKGDKALQTYITNDLEECRSEIWARMKGKMLFEMGSDGEPTWNPIEVIEQPASVLFYFKRTAESTTYFPIVTCGEEKIHLPDPSAYMVCFEQAWFIMKQKLYGFDTPVDGKKLLPFLTKDKVIIPKKLEKKYYEKFISQLIESFPHVHAEGFTIATEQVQPQPVLILSELTPSKSTDAPQLYETPEVEMPPDDETGKILFTLSFKYGRFSFGGVLKNTGVVMQHENNEYTFHRVIRNEIDERNFIVILQKMGLPLKGLHTSLYKGSAFSWINENRTNLLNMGFEVRQPYNHDKKYFVGKAEMKLEVRESIDWFDIHATIRFGEYNIPFKDLRKLILKKKVEFALPNGEIAIIPEAWLLKYKDLFVHSETHGTREKVIIKKYHVQLLKELDESKLAKVIMSERLRKQENFQGIKKYTVPKTFVGQLRPYQQAGFNWLLFLHDFRLGGCLADDMGLGKTIQTLALLQYIKDKSTEQHTSLIIMPTSLIYNWAKEAAKYTPTLNVHMHSGGLRKKDLPLFSNYDIILTSYGVTRRDIDVLEKIPFYYCILDESQVIKNPSSNVTKAVQSINAQFFLTLTGTPIENTSLDLWSQMTFINRGILGTLTYFRKEFLVPIEKKGDTHKAEKLGTIIKPFILRRLKSQVAFDLPEKTENIYYSNMTPDQESRYEEVKSMYREKILHQIEKEGINNSRFTILEGLNKLRQISNHPRLVDPDYTGESGKMNDVSYMIDNALLEGHKLLVFSQYVKHLTLYREMLRHKEIAFAYLDGSTSEKERVAQIHKFNTEETIKLFLISIKAGGLGLNLTEADYVFILDPWWNPAIEAQATDRAHRIGQKRKVFTYKFIMRNTVEEKILLLQNRKLKLSDNLIHAEQSIVKQITREDVEMLLGY